ncbi:MAG TPA: FAD binding domain-containing protein [Solirubrobacteraceae bacterium]|nr:FAD binding domain-containing protein [Solirubrobacteraceae bacterium]
MGARVAVMGGSLGGLTAALVLRDSGCEVDVYERSSAPLRDRGAGIVLHPATVRYLVERGVRDSGEIGVAARVLRYLGPDGEVASEQPCRYRFTSYYALYEDLLACFDAERYHLAREVTGFDAGEEGVAVRLGDDARAQADLLVCADGVRSSARARLLPDVEPAYAGYVGWRGALRESELGCAAFDALGGAITYHVLANSHVLTYPIPGVDGGVTDERMLNWLWYCNVPDGEPLDGLLTDREGVRRSASVPPGHVQERHLASLRADAAARLPGPLAEVVAATDHPFVQTVFDVEVPRMAFGRVCLIGDAAFALRPHVAAGTAKAAEDGWRLADAMAACGHDVLAALRRWEPGQLALGRSALGRTRDAGERSQFRSTWRVGDPLPFGLYRQGDSALD